MTFEQRTSIANAIWLCVLHGTLVDQDEITYPADTLRAWKKEHERRIAAELRGTSSRPAEARPMLDLIAIGPEIVAAGELVGTSGRSWQLQIEHFVSGDIQAIIRFGEVFADLKAADRYVLVNSIGDGRVIAQPPTWRRVDRGYIIDLEVLEKFPRTRAQDLGMDLAISADGDLLSRNGTFATVAGVEALPQKIRLCLWHQRGGSPFHADFGSRLGEYYRLFLETPWLAQMIKLETVRLASIPYEQSIPRQVYTPFNCVDRVVAVELLAEEHKDHWLPARVTMDVVGVGRWCDDIPLFVQEPSAPALSPPSMTDVGPH